MASGVEGVGGLGFEWAYRGTILGLYRDNGQENGSYYLGFRVQG